MRKPPAWLMAYAKQADANGIPPPRRRVMVDPKASEADKTRAKILTAWLNYKPSWEKWAETLFGTLMEMVEFGTEMKVVPDEMVQGPLEPNEYRCAVCRQVFTYGGDEWTAGGAQQELESLLPGVSPADCAIVCDECHNTGDAEKQ